MMMAENEENRHFILVLKTIEPANTIKTAPKKEFLSNNSLHNNQPKNVPKITEV